MKMWELIRRLLESAVPAQRYHPVTVLGRYYRELKKGSFEQLPPFDQSVVFACSISAEMQQIGLIELAKSGSWSGGMTRTAFGEELHHFLKADDAVKTLESNLVELDAHRLRNILNGSSVVHER